MSGLIAALLHATLLTWIGFDRTIVPSTFTNIWIVWYFYTIIQISRGKLFVLPLLGLLIGLIWHIHIALLPTLFTLPFAFLMGRKKPTLKQSTGSIIAFFILSIPLIVFEIRHRFIQSMGLINNFTQNHGGGSGLEKLIYVSNMTVKNINNLFLSPYSLSSGLKFPFVLFILSFSIYLYVKRVIIKKEIITLSALLIGVIGFFTFSSSLVSEYYLYSIEIIFLGLVSLTLSLLITKRLGTIFILLLLGSLFVKNLYHFTNDYIYKKGYQERKAVIELIDADAKQKGFNCIGISYISTPGENTGFRYFFFLKNTHLIHPSVNISVYNIIIPDELSPEVTRKFGHIGVILPTHKPDKKTIDKSCQTPNTNLTDSLFGYVE